MDNKSLVYNKSIADAVWHKADDQIMILAKSKSGIEKSVTVKLSLKELEKKAISKFEDVTGKEDTTVILNDGFLIAEFKSVNRALTGVVINLK